MRMRFTLAILAVVILGGCGKQTLMKTPAIVADGGLDPFAAVPANLQGSDAYVFVASARTVSGSDDPARFYTDDRSREVRLGLATVEIGEDLTWDELVDVSLAAKRQTKPVIELVAYEEFGPLWTTAWPPDMRFSRDWTANDVDRQPTERFLADVEAMLDQTKRRQITVYVHGFNTKFAGNVGIAAEFWHYMARDGVMISFDWPSEGSLFSYQVDKANADFAVRQLRKLLEALAGTSADAINIIGHSAGAPIVAEALRQLSLIYYDLDDDEARRRAKIGRVVLAAPDMDLESALSCSVDGAGRLTQGFALYASTKDKALKFSGNIFKDIRLGRSIGKLDEGEKAAIIANDAQWIDATVAQERSSSFIGHSYYHQNPWVSSDVMVFLRMGASAEERGLVRNEKTGFLEFPKDYEERLPEIARGLREKYLFPGE